MLFGVFVVLPVCLVLTGLAIVARRSGKLSPLRLGAMMVILWGPVALAASAELYWIFVEEPRRIAAGLPI